MKRFTTFLFGSLLASMICGLSAADSSKALLPTEITEQEAVVPAVAPSPSAAPAPTVTALPAPGDASTMFVRYMVWTHIVFYNNEYLMDCISIGVSIKNEDVLALVLKPINERFENNLNEVQAFLGFLKEHPGGNPQLVSVLEDMKKEIESYKQAFSDAIPKTQEAMLLTGALEILQALIVVGQAYEPTGNTKQFEMWAHTFVEMSNDAMPGVVEGARPAAAGTTAGAGAGAGAAGCAGHSEGCEES